MARKVSELTTRTSPTTTDLVPITDSAGNMFKMTTQALADYLASIAGSGDTTAPTITARAVANGTPNQINLTFSESVTATTAGFSARRNGSAWAVSSIAGSGTSWTLTMATSAASGETLDLSYDSGTGNTLDGAGNELATFTNAAVTNGISGYDSDASAFFTHSGISDTTIRDAINAHVLELKSLGLWATKIERIYPFVGGTSSTHACDLRNPSAPFNLSYRGTPTHTSNGMECGAGDVMAMTNVIPAVDMDIADLSMGVYISQDEQVSTLAKLTMGVVGANAYSLSIVARYTNDQSYYGFTDSGGNVSPSNAVAPGFYSMSRTANNVGKAFKGGAQVGSTFTTVQTTLPSTYAIGIGGGTADGAGNYLSGENQVRYAYIGLGLTDSEMLDYYNSIQDLQTALSRAV